MLIVEAHLALLDVAKKSRDSIPRTAHQHADAANTTLEGMATRGQIQGFSRREEAIKRATRELKLLAKVLVTPLTASAALQEIDCGNGICERQRFENCHTCTLDCGCKNGNFCGLRHDDQEVVCVAP